MQPTSTRVFCREDTFHVKGESWSDLLSIASLECVMKMISRCSALSGEHSNKWRVATQNEVSTMEEMGCWYAVCRPKDSRVHIKSPC